jgi:Ca-activated chloride channel homolog
LKKLFIILSILFGVVKGYSQYYIRGEIVDDKNKLLPNAKIRMHSNGILYEAGSSGSFGLMSTRSSVDTFTVLYDGYEKMTTPVFVDKYNKIKLTLLASVAGMQKNRLASLTKDLQNNYTQGFLSSNESYSDLVENDFIEAHKYPTTGFAVNTDKASYSNIRRFINMNSHVPTNAVRIDEMINYFSFPTPPPPPGKIFQINSKLTQCPWNTKNLLLYISIAAQKIDLNKLPASNLVFLVDNSGSMELQNRMPLLKSSFKMLVKNLREKDTISIVTYGGSVDIALPPTSGKYKDSILKTIEAMEAAGDTPGESAIKLAYQLAKKSFIANGNNRVILATDGDFNVGIADEAELERMISIQSHSGIYLTCLGVGMGNYKDSKLEVLAKKGNGNFAYIDSEIEAEKILVKEMTQTLFSVADKTFMNVRFNKQYVNQYRLLGFDNKVKALVDSASAIEGGEVGSGYNSMVLFEIDPTGIVNLDAMETIHGEEIAQVLIHYTDPKTKKENDFNYQCNINFDKFNKLDSTLQFATSVAMFGGYIKQSKFMKNVTLESIMVIASQNVHPTDKLQVEFLQLLQKAEKIYEIGKKKKKKKAKASSI